MKLAVMSEDGKVQLPPEVIRQFPSKEKFVVAVDGNAILLNAIKQPKLSAIAEKRKEEPMPMEEIVKEIHLHRQERKPKK